ncbi:IucA/IucC family C-terminal-domain containing protein [Lysinibacillus sp. SGAir0095]|uniref:IucA/IucC family C-terminal-domain containing protein n=1 Tax=Lysinibacillus sp. SGAir0095 TaxID=2070463 RepID=UPI00143D0EDE|nr:IucA/IucC family C-terminal-domain containing protein [Lysinibacillus sp. SGAir0095]
MTKKEIQILQKYRLKTEFTPIFRVEELKNDDFLQEFIAKLTKVIGAPSEKVAASIFIKRYAFVAVIALYAMTSWNKKVNVNLDMIDMEAPELGKKWLPSVELKDLTVEEWDMNIQERAEWRQDVIRNLFSQNIYPIFTKFEKTFGISKLILWENIAIYIFWLYETELNSNNKQAFDDFNYLIFEADGSLFSEFKGNPLQRFYGKKTSIEHLGEEVRMRKTCCFSYQLAESNKRCKTCPCAHLSKDGGCVNENEDISCSVQDYA